LTQLADEHLFKVPWGTHVDLNAEEAIKVSKTLLRQSLDGGYSAIAAQFHVDPFALGGEYATRAGRWLEGTLEYAAAERIPIWSAEEWLRFTEIRHDATLEEVHWETAARRLSFRLTVQKTPDVELAVMVPLWHGEARLAQVEVDGIPVEHRERKVGGVSYGWASVETGSHRIVMTFA